MYARIGDLDRLIDWIVRINSYDSKLLERVDDVVGRIESSNQIIESSNHQIRSLNQIIESSIRQVELMRPPLASTYFILIMLVGLLGLTLQMLLIIWSLKVVRS